MNDPIETFESIRDFYITYLETAFRIGDPDIQVLRRALLEEVGTLCAEPLVEPLPRYVDCGLRIDDLKQAQHGAKWLPKFSDEQRTAFVDLCLGGLLPEDLNKPGTGRFKLFKHQLEMLQRGVGTGTAGIVTSGTGSGKTEAFMLPIFAAISREATSWPAADGLRTWRPWWTQEESQPTFLRDVPREAASRPKAVRALILYPMNALVEDQMVRLRRALDSSSAVAAMEKHFKGNGIFYGRYTGATKVTGWLQHPRVSDQAERRRAAEKVEDLREYMRLLAATQEEALRQVDQGADEALPFNFSRAAGNEIVSRWDMQRHPPDILITNTSMLSTLLVREIDEPIFAQTRDWLKSDPDAYFFLVLDELHLQRGSAGTEVAYLLRMLLGQLGLTSPQLRHKLRILCSSASLPMEGQAREQSLDYLWGLFGSAGLPEHANRNDWSSAIVEGAVERTAPNVFTGNASALCICLREMRSTVTNEDLGGVEVGHWKRLISLLGEDSNGSTAEAIASQAVQRAGALLEAACIQGEQKTTRASTLSDMARRLFGTDKDGRQAVELLIWLRSCSDHWKSWFATEIGQVPLARFRVHTFLRALEGLFVAPLSAPSNLPRAERANRLFADLSVESGARYGHREVEGRRSRRVDLLYCECCGVLFFGGKRSQGSSDRIELLPNDPDTDALPERAKVNLVEQRSAEDYSLFMPTLDRHWPVGPEDISDEEAQGRWRQAEYDTYSATITKLAPGTAESHRVRGWHYYVDAQNFKADEARGQLSPADGGTALPLQCPACATSYRPGRGRGKSSPIRGFRVGFAKTTQLLASTLLGELQKSNDNERLVSFSDSRQDAAKAALDLEGGHHDDVRRELIVRCLQTLQGTPRTQDDIQADLAAVKKRQRELANKDSTTLAEDEEMKSLAEKRQRLQASLLLQQDCVSMRDLVEPLDPSPGAMVKPVLAGLVNSGIHPTDRTGVTPVPEPVRGQIAFAWQQLFTRSQEGWRWLDNAVFAAPLAAARREIAGDLLRLVGSTIFSKTYFAVEEAGWGYPCLPLREGQNREQLATYDAMIRVLADSNRTRPSQFEDRNSPWSAAGDVPARQRLRKFAVAMVSGQGLGELIDGFLAALSAAGHLGGIVYIDQLWYRTVEPKDPYWRCENCGRVHLHLGGRICTRCYAALNPAPSGEVQELRNSNFLGKRVLRSPGVRRLRAEELTGMTNNPAARLRRFKGILIQDDDDILPPGFSEVGVDLELDRAARVVDVLTVTTTMEVGVDIGDLRAVFQANMPPQRFNYQQRVGRAGRRGQAYSMVLTVCRSKSHDLHYFRHPDQITGDPPPPPFLTTSLDLIAHRLILKLWLVLVFRALREKHSSNWPGDDLRSSPDNHGEFFLVDRLRKEKTKWYPLIRDELGALIQSRDAFALLCAQGDASRSQRLCASLTPSSVMDAIDEIVADRAMADRGLAEALAEYGKFPMYGMPTRIRVLHTRPTTTHQHQIAFATMDRDLDVALQEFAPGRILVQDKRRYFTAGYAGDSIRKIHGLPQVFKSVPDDLGAVRDLAECPVCLAWSPAKLGVPVEGVCKACGAERSAGRVYSTFVPRGFITSLVTRKPEELGEELTTRATRTSVAEAEQAPATFRDNSNMRMDVRSQSQVYRLNRGEYKDNKWTGFSAQQGDLRASYTAGGVDYPLTVKGVWIDDAAKALDTGMPSLDSRFRPTGEVRTEFYLSAPKITESLVMSPATVPSAWEVIRPSATGELLLSPAFRAGALSACFLIVNYASRQLLDVDPEEFEILEPRVQSMADGSIVPVLQLADELVNGSGLCNRLGQPGPSGDPIVLEVIRAILMDRNSSPLRDLLAKEHAEECVAACYRCLHRFGNQGYHGLLDWRLGLDVLQLLLRFDYLAGVDGDFSSPGVEDWRRLAGELAVEAASLFSTPLKLAGGINLVGIGPERWAAVVHPFWSRDALYDNNPELEVFASKQQVELVTTFDLSRRMGQVLLALRSA